MNQPAALPALLKERTDGWEADTKRIRTLTREGGRGGLRLVAPACPYASASLSSHFVLDSVLRASPPFLPFLTTPGGTAGIWLSLFHMWGRRGSHRILFIHTTCVYVVSFLPGH